MPKDQLQSFVDKAPKGVPSEGCAAQQRRSASGAMHQSPMPSPPACPNPPYLLPAATCRCCKAVKAFNADKCQCDPLLKSVIGTANVTPQGLDGVLQIVGLACKFEVAACG